MKTTIYISGIAGTILLVLRLLGLFITSLNNNLLLFLGLGLMVLIFLPLLFLDKKRQDDEIKSIIDSYEHENGKMIFRESKKPETKGWSMNNSPYRERKSGLTWGGGNIHAAGAKRGSRRKFL